MANKRGAMSIEMIIVIILALITLVVVAAAFTGGMKQLIDKISGVTSAIPEADRLAAKVSCEQYCSAGAKDIYCNPSFTGTLATTKCPAIAPCANISC